MVAWFQLRSRQARLLAAAIAAGGLLCAGGAFWLTKDNTAVQNALFHTQDHSASSVSSNDAHVSAFRSGVTDVLQQPLGDGPGTAGPASVYNSDHPARIAENYYVQIAQETGWLGLALFLSGERPAYHAAR